MSRYIDADWLYRYIKTECNPYGAPTLDFDTSVKIMKIIENTLTADVKEVRHGHWFFDEYDFFTCSRCRESYYNSCRSTKEAKRVISENSAYQYCPFCGAKMDGKDDL